MFKMIDTDNSSQITFEKLKVGLKTFGATLSESEIFDLMQAVSVSSSELSLISLISQNKPSLSPFFMFSQRFFPI